MNSILDEGHPTLSGSISADVAIRNILGVDLQLDPPRNVYSRGWGTHGVCASQIVCSWSPITEDVKHRTTAITFDFTTDDFPLAISLELQRYSRRYLLLERPVLTLQRPQDQTAHVLPIYITQSSPLNSLLCLDVTGLYLETNYLTAVSNMPRRHI